MRATNAWRFGTPTRGLLLWSGVKNGSAYGEYGDATSFDSWISPTNRTKLRNAGFDWIRFHFAWEFAQGLSAGTKSTRLAAYIANIQTLVASGFKVICGIDITSAGASVYDGVAGTNWTEICDFAADMAAALHTVNNPVWIAMEPINEPPGIITNYVAHTGVMNARIRAVNAKLCIFTMAHGWQGDGYTRSLDGTLFTDNRIGCAYHFYPEPYTQQGLGGADWHQSFQRIEVPVVVGDKTAQLAALETRMTALGVASGNKPELRNEVSLYYDTPMDEAWIATQHSSTVSHLTGLGLSTNMILCSEWNVTGDGKTVNGADATSRAAGLAITRAGIEAAGIGWGLNQLFGYSGTDAIYGQGIVDNSFNFDSSLLAALIP